MHIRPYQKLVTWQEAHKLCVAIDSQTKQYPEDERFGLISQMRRSASSVPTNIAEGNAKKSPRDKYRFFEISKASLEELHYQCLLSKELKYICTQSYEDLDDRIQRVSYLLVRLRSVLQ